MMFVIDTSALIHLYIPDGPLPDGFEAAFYVEDPYSVFMTRALHADISPSS
jgi:hypothetical protein